MIDITVLRTLNTRAGFDQYYSSIPLAALETRTAVLVDDIKRYYDLFPDNQELDLVTFKDCFFQHWHRGMKDDMIDYYNKIIDHASKPVPDAVKDNLINSLIELQTATDLANIVEAYQQEDEIDLLTAVEELLEKAREKQLANEDQYAYVEPDLAEIMQEDTDNSGIPWPIAGLNRHCRPLRPGDQVVVAARPGKGKTSLSAAFADSAVRYKDDNRPVLWLSNEGTVRSIHKRALQCILRETIPGLLARQEAGTLEADYLEVIGQKDRLQIRDIGGYTNFEVKSLIEAVQPKMVILDMIDKIKFLGMSANAREDRVLEEKYAWFRELAIKMDYVNIATSQISASAEESEALSLWPRQDMLKDSKTGKQGACDTILMMGASQDKSKQDLRTFSTPKTKHEIYGQRAPNIVTIFDAQRCIFQEVNQ